MGGIGVLVTRTLPGAKRTGATLQGLGYNALISPVLAIRPTTMAVPDLREGQALIATSAHGVTAIANIPDVRDLPLFCLSGASLQTAREKGFSDSVHARAITARSLYQTIQQTLTPKNGPVLWVRGRHFAFDMKAALAEQGFEVREWEAYEACPVNTLTKEVCQAIHEGTIKAVLFHSARGAKAFIALAQKTALSLTKITAIAISTDVAACLENHGFFQVYSAHMPEEEAMIGALQNHFPT